MKLSAGKRAVASLLCGAGCAFDAQFGFETREIAKYRCDGESTPFTLVF